MRAALNRKGKSDGINEEDNVGGVMNSVVATHNSMNEMTWDRVMLWERLHPETTSTTQLNRFIGRPHDLSPLARLRTLRGLAAPFDRHDWFVVREDDREVRYVIDFYFNEDRAGHSDVRPPPTRCLSLLAQLANRSVALDDHAAGSRALLGGVVATRWTLPVLGSTLCASTHWSV